MNPKTAAAIEAARERTRQILAEAEKRKASPVSGLPSSANLQLVSQTEALAPELKEVLTILKPDGTSFDPFEIPGVGRANAEQSRAIQIFGLEGKSGCLIGPAGTGKTTTMRAIINAMIQSGRIPILPEDLAHKYLEGGLPGIYGGAFTRIATRNLRQNCPADIQANIHTHHRLLEFEPESFSVTDEKTGKEKQVRVFKPTRNAFRTLPIELIVFIFDETSMLGLRLHSQIIDAIHPKAKPQMLYIGDIAQIPPVMDDAILGYKMLETLKENTCVELTQVYRHAGAIVNLANHIRVGNTIPDNRTVIPYVGALRKLPKAKIDEWFNKDLWAQTEEKKWTKTEDGSTVTIQMWKNRLDGETGQIRAMNAMGLKFFPEELEAGRYDPMKHMILIPYNKAVGTIELNKHIANYIGKKNESVVYEVIAGREKQYLAIGDKIFFEREEAIITKITINDLYAGRAPQKESKFLDRWGHNAFGKEDSDGFQDDVSMLLNIDIGGMDDDERKNQASHVIYIRKIADLDKDIQDDSIQTAGEINSLLMGYALTIHKSQGSQWEKVYCVFHNSHNRNLQRELLYTAITRAQKELYIICEPETFVQGVLSQHIVGNTLEEKAKFFIAKAEEAKRRDDLFSRNGGK